MKPTILTPSQAFELRTGLVRIIHSTTISNDIQTQAENYYIGLRENTPCDYKRINSFVFKYRGRK